WRIEYIVSDAPPPAELHGSGIHLVHFRLHDLAVALLQQQATYTAPAELEAQRQPDGTTSDDNDFRPPLTIGNAHVRRAERYQRVTLYHHGIVVWGAPHGP